MDRNLNNWVLKELWFLCIGLFFFSMLLATGTLQEIRGIAAIFLFLLFVASVFLQHTKIVYDKKLFFFSLAAISVSMLAVSLGLLNGNIGAFQSIGVYLVWPLIFLFMLGGVGEFRIFLVISKALIMGSSVICALIIGQLIDAKLGLGLDKFWEIFRIRSGLFMGANKVSSPMLPVLFYFVPFSLTLILLRNRRDQRLLPKFWVKLNAAAFFMSCMVLLLSGRAAAALVFITMIPVCYWILSKNRQSTKGAALIPYVYGMIGGLGAVSIIWFLFYDLLSLLTYADLLVEKVFYVHDPNSVGHRRYEQFINLVGFIQENPFFGRGMGGVEKIGSDVWQFELSYLSLLDQVGVVGFFIYSAGFFFLIRELIKIVKRGGLESAFASAVTSGLVVFLIVNATNPLLSKFDFLWIIFLPRALVNFSRTRKRIP